MEKEYKAVFESIRKHNSEHAEIASKIQKKVHELKTNRNVYSHINNFLDLHIKESMPAEQVVNIARLRKLENIVESIKDNLCMSDESIEAKKAELDKVYTESSRLLNQKIANLEKQLKESTEKNQVLAKKVDMANAKKLLESKVKDLPAYEAKQLKERFQNATTADVETKFNKVLESVKDEIQEESDAEVLSLEAEIRNIVDDEVKSAEKKSDSTDKSVKEAEKKDDKSDKSDSDADDDEDYKTEVDIDDDEEDTSIGESFMKNWIRRSAVSNH